jgi:hypothetical protein
MNSKLDPGFINYMAAQLATQLDKGRDIIFQVAMRDWGGEVKPLRVLLKAFVALLPLSRWRLTFRPERVGVENMYYLPVPYSLLKKIGQIQASFITVSKYFTLHAGKVS